MSSSLFRRSAASKAEYDASASACVRAAQDEAAALRHSEVRVEHFLLGVLAVEGPARAVLERFGLGLEEARRAVAAEHPRGERLPRGGATFDPSTRPVLERAAEAARSLGDAAVTSAHVLLGVIAAGGGAAAPVLRDHGVDAATVRAALHESPSGPSAGPSTRSGGELHRVVPLHGSATDWEEQLDAVAAEGWELVSVAPLGGEVRAVFRGYSSAARSQPRSDAPAS